MDWAQVFMSYSITRVKTILVLGYWVLGNIHRYWIVLLLYFWLFWYPIQYQSDSSQHHPHASERLFSSACSCNHLSGHHADMLLFIKHNHCHHHIVLGFFVVTAMLYTSIDIGAGIGIARGQYYWILGAFLGIVLTLSIV